MAKPQKKKQQIGVPEVRRNNAPLLIGAGVLVVGILVIAAIVTFAGQGNTSDDSVKGQPYQPVTVSGQALPAQPESSGGPDTAVGQIAPALEGRTFTGDPVSIKADGKPKIVMFFAHWCPHCNNELPIISKFLTKNAKSKYSDVGFYAVATASSPQQVRWPPQKWIAQNKYPLPVMADDEKSTAANAYGLGSYPYLVSLDGNDKVIARTSGEMTVDKYEQFVKTAASTAGKTDSNAGAPQTTATTGASSPATAAK